MPVDAEVRIAAEEAELGGAAGTIRSEPKIALGAKALEGDTLDNGDRHNRADGKPSELAAETGCEVVRVGHGPARNVREKRDHAGEVLEAIPNDLGSLSDRQSAVNA